MTFQFWVERIIKGVFRTAGLEVQRFRGASTEDAVLARLLGILKPEMVLDVGANAGQYALALRRLGYKGLILSFEALPDVHHRLAAKARGDSGWQVAPCSALGSVNTELLMNVAGNEASSSLLEMSESHRVAAPESAYVNRIRVPVRRLDDTSFAHLLPTEGQLFLKVDTQGYEKEVLAGASALLPSIVAIQLELSLIELYEGAPLLSEMVSLVEGLGFELYGLCPGFKDRKTGRLLQVDGFFVRRGSCTATSSSADLP